MRSTNFVVVFLSFFTICLISILYQNSRDVLGLDTVEPKEMKEGTILRASTKGQVSASDDLTLLESKMMQVDNRYSNLRSIIGVDEDSNGLGTFPNGYTDVNNMTVKDAVKYLIDHTPSSSNGGAIDVIGVDGSELKNQTIHLVDTAGIQLYLPRANGNMRLSVCDVSGDVKNTGPISILVHGYNYPEIYVLEDYNVDENTVHNKALICFESKTIHLPPISSIVNTAFTFMIYIFDTNMSIVADGSDIINNSSSTQLSGTSLFSEVSIQNGAWNVQELDSIHAEGDNDGVFEVFIENNYQHLDFFFANGVWTMSGEQKTVSRSYYISEASAVLPSLTTNELLSEHPIWQEDSIGNIYLTDGIWNGFDINQTYEIEYIYEISENNEAADIPQNALVWREDNNDLHSNFKSIVKNDPVERRYHGSFLYTCSSTSGIGIYASQNISAIEGVQLTYMKVKIIQLS
jgi:hypothetical protein